jgi:hypothetical protein
MRVANALVGASALQTRTSGEDSLFDRVTNAGVVASAWNTRTRKGSTLSPFCQNYLIRKNALNLLRSCQSDNVQRLIIQK